MENGMQSVFAGVYEHNLVDADREFRRVRARALLRSVFGTRARGEGDSETMISAQATVPISSIMGVIDREGRAVQGFPRLRRAHADRWRKDFLDPEAGSAPLTVQQGPGGLYLMGGVPATVLLETLKAKNQTRVRVTLWTPKVLEVGCDPCGDSTPCPEAEAVSARAAS